MGAVSTCGQPACPVVRVPWAAHHRGRCAGRFDGAEVRKGASELSRRPPPPIPFDEFAKRWLRVRVELPIEREEEESLSLSSARSHEQQIRLYLIPFLGSHDVRKLNVALVDGLWDRFIETGKPRSRRSREIALGTLRRILGSAVAKEILLANPVDQWKAGRLIAARRQKVSVLGTSWTQRSGRNSSEPPSASPPTTTHSSCFWPRPGAGSQRPSTSAG